MTLRLVGCTHHQSSVAVRERLAFNPGQAEQALQQWNQQFPDTEAVLLSTCNRMELYTASTRAPEEPTHRGVARFLADFHKLPADEVFAVLFEESGEDAVRHLFQVAASLDSMVLGESQILGQVRQAYLLANETGSTGPVTHQAFQAAMRVARRVTTETSINQRRLSIPSVAILDFASQIFERFDDKEVLLIGAGEMAQETVRYLLAEGARKITVVNRSPERARQLAEQCGGRAAAWTTLHDACVAADLVVSTTGGDQAIITAADFKTRIAQQRHQRPLMILDLAIPRDFEPAVGDFVGVYLYSLDDLSEVCEQNRRARNEELPKALEIIDAETAGFMTEFYHRANAPTIRRLREGWQESKQQELDRLLKRLPDLGPDSHHQIEVAFDRLINKLLHLPLESLKNESRYGPPERLLDALKRLFQLRD